MSQAIPVARITHLAATQNDAAFSLVHPRDALLDVKALNAAEGTSFEPLPAPHLHGVAYSNPLPRDQIMLDQALLGQRSLQLWCDGAYEEVALKDLAGGQVVRASVPIPTAESGDCDRDRVDAAVSEFTDLRIQQRLDETLEIPPLPEAARRIVTLQSDPNFDLTELVGIVETDPAIAAKIMSWSNSAFYAANPPARSLDDAIMRILGFDLVMNLALGLVLAGTLRLPSSQVRGAPPVWLQAVFTAAAMEALSRKLPGDAPSPGSCYLTGLLSNFGTLVLGHVFPPQYSAICALQEANPHISTKAVDEHVIKLPREVLAATLLEQWDIPEEIVTAIRHQHTQAYAGSHATWANLLQVANQMLRFDITGQEAEYQEGSLERIGLCSEDLAEVSQLLTDSQAELEGFARAVA